MNKQTVITLDSDTFAEEISSIYSDLEKEKIITTTYQIAIDRIFEIFSKHNLKITFFLITSHLQYQDVSKTCRNILSAGHEIADHSYSHKRNLTELTKLELEKEIYQSKKLIIKKLGISPLGFRSPGAEIDLNMLNILATQKYFYDSSSNTSLLYEKAKKIYFKIKGKDYKHYKINNTDTPIKIGSFCEFPITISTFLNIPLFNFFMVQLKKLGLKVIEDTMKKKEYVNYTLHLHEFISPKEIIGVNIKNGLMNIRKLKISEKLSFLDKALHILKNSSDVTTLQTIYYTLMYGYKNDKN